MSPISRFDNQSFGDGNAAAIACVQLAGCFNSQECTEAPEDGVVDSEMLCSIVLRGGGIDW